MLETASSTASAVGSGADWVSSALEVVGAKVLLLLPPNKLIRRIALRHVPEFSATTGVVGGVADGGAVFVVLLRPLAVLTSEMEIERVGDRIESIESALLVKCSGTAGTSGDCASGMGARTLRLFLDFKSVDRRLCTVANALDSDP